MNREEYLQKTFPLKDGTTYIQSIDKFNEPKGAGAGGESIKENFIDSAPSSSNSVDSSVDSSVNRSSDWMYNWIRKHSGK